MGVSINSDVTLLRVSNSLRTDNALLQERASNVSQQVKFRSYSDLQKEGLVTQYINLESDLSDTNNMLRSNQLLYERLDAVNQRLEALEEDVRDNLQDIISAGTPWADREVLRTLVTSRLESMQSLLNSSDAYGKIFAGTDTNLDPVGDIVNNSNIVNGEATNNYIQTNQQKFYLPISETRSVQANITADEPAFMNLIGSYHLLLSNDEAEFNKGIAMFNRSMNDLSSLNAKVKRNLEAVHKQKEVQQNHLEYIENANELFRFDLAEGQTQLIQSSVQMMLSTNVQKKLLEAIQISVNSFKDL